MSQMKVTTATALLLALATLLVGPIVAEEKLPAGSGSSGTTAAADVRPAAATTAGQRESSSSAAELDPRDVVETYVAAVAAGKVEDAAALTQPGTAPASKERIEELQRALKTASLLYIKGVPLLMVPTAWTDDRKGVGLVLSEQLKFPEARAGNQNTGRFLFWLIRSHGKWWLNDMRFESEAEAAKTVARFRKDYPDAKQPPPKPISVEVRVALEAPREQGDQIVGIFQRLNIHYWRFVPQALGNRPTVAVIKTRGHLTYRTYRDVARLIDLLNEAGIDKIEIGALEGEGQEEGYGSGATSTNVRSSAATVVGSVALPPGVAGAAGESNESGTWRNYVESPNVALWWPETRDAIWAFSKRLGIWTKQEVTPASKVQFQPVVGKDVVALEVGNTIYAYSTVVGKWGVLRLPAGERPLVTVGWSMVLVRQGDAIHTFTASTGRWTSPGSPETGTSARAGIVEELRNNYRQLEEQAARLAEQYRKLVAEKKGDTASAAKLKRQLTETVAQAFEARQKLQRAQLEALRQRLERIEQRLDARDRIKDAIIERRVDELLHPNLRWQMGDHQTSAGKPARAISH